MDAELSEVELQVLRHEQEWWRGANGFSGMHEQSREESIAKPLGMSSTRYFLILGHLLDDERAYRFDPQLIPRLQNLRDNRRAERG